MAFITVTDIRHRHLSTDDIHQINKSIKPFVADKKKKIKKNLPLYNLTLERTLMTCDLKKLGCFFFSLPEMKPSVLMMLAGMSTMLMWESVIRMHTTALAPGLLVKRDLNIQKWQSGLSHVKPETPRYHRVWGGRGGWHGRELRWRATPTLLCFWWCHSRTRKKTHSLYQSEPKMHTQRASQISTKIG